MTSLTYSYLAGGQGDYMRGLSTHHQTLLDWKFKNNLPMDVYVFIQKINTDYVVFGAKVDARKEVSFRHTALNPGDIVHTYWYYKDGVPPAKPSSDYDGLLRIMPQYTLTGFAKTITLGGAEYTTLMGNGEFKSSSKDISGITIYNRMFIPIQMYYNGEMVGMMKMNDGMSVLGGTQSGFLFRGSMWNGINLGDKFTFKYVDKELFTVTISDRNCLEMFVGVVTAGYTDPREGYDVRYTVP
jgi:hypothetical protein